MFTPKWCDGTSFRCDQNLVWCDVFTCFFLMPSPQWSGAVQLVVKHATIGPAELTYKDLESGKL